MLRVLLALAVVSSCPGLVNSQTYQWNGIVSSRNWNTPTVWLPTSGPPGAGSTANFGYITGATTNLVDLSGNGSAGILNFTDVNSAYSLSGGMLALNNGGADTQINVSGVFSAAVTFQSSAPITSATNLTITNNGRWGGDASCLTIDSAVSLPGLGLAINTTSYARTQMTGAITAGTLAVGGNGYVILGSNTNNFGSSIQFNGGLVQVDNNLNLGTSDATSLVFNGGTLRLGSATTSSGKTINVATGQTGSIEVTGQNTWTFNGATPLTGGGTLRKLDTGTLAIASPSSFTGTVAVGTLGFNVISPASATAGANHVISQSSTTLNSPVNTLQLSGNGTLAAAAGGIRVQNYSRFAVAQANAGNAGDTLTLADRIGTIPITLNGGEFHYTPATGVAVNDTVGPLSIAGVSVVRFAATAGHAGGQQITFNDTVTPANSLARADRAALYFGASPSGNGQLGGTPGASTVNVKATGVSDSGGSGPSRGIVPWAAVTDAAAVNYGLQTGNNPQTFATYDSNGFRPLAASETVTVPNASPFVAGQNNNLTGSPTTLTGPVTIQSLIATGGNPTVNGAAHVLTISSGAILAITPILSSSSLTFNNGVIDFNNQTAYVHMGENDIVLSGGSTIRNADGVVVSSINNFAPRLDLTASGANAFAGGLFVYGTLTTPNLAVFSAGVRFANDNQLGATDGAITLDGGVLRAAPASGATIALSNRTVTLAGPGGLSAQSNRTLQVPGLITGPGQLVVNSAINSFSGETGTVSLTNATANTYAGGTYLAGGTLAVSRGDSLGSGLLVFAGPSGTNLRADAAVTIPNAVVVGSQGATVNTNGNALTLSGTILGDATLTKSGNGSLTLSGTSPYSGTITVNTGSLVVDGTLGHTTNAVTVSSGTTLGGDGTINRRVVVSGTLAPGSGPGVLTVNAAATAVTFNANSQFTVEIQGSTAGPGANGYDQVRLVSGNVSIGSTVALNLPSPSGTFTAADRLYLLRNDGAGTTTGTFNGLPEGAAVPALAGLGGFPAWNIYYGANFAANTLAGGNDIALAPVPEPGTVLAFAMGVIGICGYGRTRGRRINRAAP